MTEKVKINFIDNNIVTETYMEASGQCGGWTRKPSLVEYVRFQKNWDGITLFTDNFISSVDTYKSKYKVAWLMEPREFNSKHYEQIPLYEASYDLILTYEKNLLARDPKKYVQIPADFTVVEKENQVIHPKTKLCSMVYSNKQFMPGHKLRHEIANISVFGRYIDYYGSGTRDKHLVKKSEALIPYIASVAIENSKVENYFTEKILDCFVTGTIPIFWGATNIGNFFNPNGIINFNNTEQLLDILKHMNIEEFYNKPIVQEAVKENYQIATEKYSESDDVIYKMICERLGL